MNGTTKQTGWSARCECRKGHNSASGRCNERGGLYGVTDPTATSPDDAVFCAECREHCMAHVVEKRLAC